MVSGNHNLSSRLEYWLKGSKGGTENLRNKGSIGKEMLGGDCAATRGVTIDVEGGSLL